MAQKGDEEGRPRQRPCSLRSMSAFGRANQAGLMRPSLLASLAAMKRYVSELFVLTRVSDPKRQSCTFCRVLRLTGRVPCRDVRLAAVQLALSLDRCGRCQQMTARGAAPCCPLRALAFSPSDVSSPNAAPDVTAPAAPKGRRGSKLCRTYFGWTTLPQSSPRSRCVPGDTPRWRAPGPLPRRVRQSFSAEVRDMQLFPTRRLQGCIHQAKRESERSLAHRLEAQPS